MRPSIVIGLHFWIGTLVLVGGVYLKSGVSDALIVLGFWLLVFAAIRSFLAATKDRS